MTGGIGIGIGMGTALAVHVESEHPQPERDTMLLEDDKELATGFADDWLPPFIDAYSLTPTHPLRAAAMSAAEAPVRAAYADNGGERQSVAAKTRQQVAGEQVILVLHGIAAVLTQTTANAVYADALAAA